MTSLDVPAYGRGSLSDLMPSVLHALGVRAAEPPPIELPQASAICVLLVDGLGAELLSDADERDAPFLRARLPDAQVIDAGFPASTPISLCSVGTGRPPGEHGIVGFTMHVPPVAGVVECLTWADYQSGIDLTARLPPAKLQPVEPLFEEARRRGVESTVVSLRAHEGSGLTRAAFRGATFSAFEQFEDMDSRLELVARALAADRAFVYTYDARLDTAAHSDGVGSEPWRAALRETDRLAERLSRAIAPGLLVVTGDHGGRNISVERQVDLADEPELALDVAWLSGEPRARYVHATDGRADGVHERWSDRLGPDWDVLSRGEAVAAGLFGPFVSADVLPRIGEVVAIARGSGGIYDRKRYPWELRFRALHGALTSAERLVPVLAI